MPLEDCTIVLVRHAHSEMAGRFCGESDPPLSEQGRLQLARLAEVPAGYPLTHIFSSDLRRAQETASAIATKQGMVIELLSALREMRFGEWEGLSWDQVSARDAAYAARWMAEYPQLPAPGGEPFNDFRLRVRGALAEVAARSAGGCAAVVTHSGVIRTFLLDVLGLPESELAGLACEYASCLELRLQGGRWRRVSGDDLQEMQTKSER
jgi:alpha-ribazole phosphatase/probable phosphoglycerate mutase